MPECFFPFLRGTFFELFSLSFDAGEECTAVSVHGFTMARLTRFRARRSLSPLHDRSEGAMIHSVTSRDLLASCSSSEPGGTTSFLRFRFDESH